MLKTYYQVYTCKFSETNELIKQKCDFISHKEHRTLTLHTVVGARKISKINTLMDDHR